MSLTTTFSNPPELSAHPTFLLQIAPSSACSLTGITGCIMSAGEIPIIRLITTRLSQLLNKARQIKPSTSIEPPLPIAQIEEDTKSIAVPELSIGQSTPQQAALETVARNLLFQILSAYNINDPDFVNIWNLLDILQSCADNKQCEAALPLWVIEELLDSQTIDGCSKVFDYLESRRERLVRVSTSQSIHDLV